MQIARFWSRAEGKSQTPAGKWLTYALWRGSAGSQAEAETRAREAVQRVGKRIEQGEGFPERYVYPERQLREEVLQEIRSSGRELEAALTRNAYGAVVLNAARVLFIDVDLPESAAPPPPVKPPSEEPSFFWRLFEALFGSAPVPQRAAKIDPILDAQAKRQQWLATHRDWGMRVYRTRSGFRYLVTHTLFEPGDAGSEEAMSSLGCDPNYMMLCRAQKSFRARLTPKSWRCGVPKLTVRFPWASDADKAAMRAWEAKYDSAARGYATCAFVEALGDGTVHPAIAPLMELHDTQTRARSGLPLA